MASWKSTVNGQRLIGHGGAFNGWMTTLQLIPEENAGIYVSANTWVEEEVLHKMVQKFMDHYFPALEAISDSNPAATSIAAGDNLSRYTGVYVSSRKNFSTPEKLQALSTMTWVGSSAEITLRFPHLLEASYGVLGLCSTAGFPEYPHGRTGDL